MSDFNKVDDLLEEVEGLELAEEGLNEKVGQVQQKREELKQVSSEAGVDSSLMALEAAKTAQEAATQSQEATQATLKLSDELRSHSEELSNANLNWRQSVRHASQEMAASKKLFVTMMIITLALGLAAIGLMGGIYYNMQNKHEQLKGEILDVIQTENALFTKALNVKIDELGSQIEASRYYVEQLVQKPQASQVTAQTEQSTAQETLPEITPGGQKASQPEQQTIEAAQQPEQSKQPVQTAVAQIDSRQIQQLLQSELQPLQEKMLQQVTQLAKQQNALSKELSQLSSQMSQIAKQPKMVTTAGTAKLDAKQSQQLADIRWLVSKHDKKLLTISNQLKRLEEPDQSKTAWQKQINQVQLQQKMIQTELQKLQQNVQDLTDKVNKNQPYSYKAK